MMMNVWVQGSATMDKAPKVKNWLQFVGLSLTVSHSRAPWFGGIQSPSVRPNDWEVNKPRAKTQNLWKTHRRFQAQRRPRSGRGKLQVTSEIFGHQVKTFTLDVTLSEVPWKQLFLFERRMLQFFVIENPRILTASISWCLSHKILKRMVHEILFRIVSLTRILCGFFYPMVRQRPKMKGTRFPVFAGNLVII